MRKVTNLENCDDVCAWVEFEIRRGYLNPVKDGTYTTNNIGRKIASKH